MGRSSKMSAVKRQRERKKQEKAAQKRERRAQRREESTGNTVASREELAAYGLIDPEED